MELYKEIFEKFVIKQFASTMLKDIDINTVVELECYNILKQIKRVIEDDNLSDEECFNKIEVIVCLFEQLGSSCGFRHDFG